MKIIICDSNDNIVDTMKSYTDLEQSKKLAEILPLESADMSYSFNFDSGIYEISLTSYKSWVVPKYAQSDDGFGQVMPCWSLAALLNVLPDTITSNDGIAFKLNIKKNIIEYSNPSLYLIYKSVKSDNIVDACYEMLLKLKENNII